MDAFRYDRHRSYRCDLQSREATTHFLFSLTVTCFCARSCPCHLCSRIVFRYYVAVANVLHDVVVRSGIFSCDGILGTLQDVSWKRESHSCNIRVIYCETIRLGKRGGGGDGGHSSSTSLLGCNTRWFRCTYIASFSGDNWQLSSLGACCLEITRHFFSHRQQTCFVTFMNRIHARDLLRRGSRGVYLSLQFAHNCIVQCILGSVCTVT